MFPGKRFFTTPVTIHWCYQQLPVLWCCSRLTLLDAMPLISVKRLSIEALAGQNYGDSLHQRDRSKKEQVFSNRGGIILRARTSAAKVFSAK
jgi:hypothetical protein